MEQATDSKPNPAFELLAVGLDALVLFGTVAVLYTQGGPALLRTVVLILLLAPAVGQLVAFLTTGGKRFDLLRMGVGAALAAIGLYLWEPEGWTWALPLVGACAVWIVSIKSAASQLAVRRHGRSAPTEEQPPQLSYTHRTILWPDVALLCLWLLPLAGTVVWLLWPAGREYVEATKESTGSFLTALAWDVVFVAFWGWSLLDCWRRKNLCDNARLVWLLFIFAGWTIGLTCYYLFVKRPELVGPKSAASS